MKTIVIIMTLIVIVVGDKMHAIVIIEPHDDANLVRGTLWFTQNYSDASVIINGTISGLSKGNHGFHIHEKGDLTDKCLSTGAHFNPHNLSHGGPSDSERHIGDLGNIQANDYGVANIHLTDNLITLSGVNSIVGRSVVVHEDQDDYGKGGHKDSKTTGHAGGRVGCGIVTIISPTGSVLSSGTSYGHQIASMIIATIALIFIRDF